MNLSSARGVANLTPFNQQGSARVCSSRAFPANSSTNYDITKYYNPPARLVGQCQFPPNLSPTYAISSSSVSGVSLNGMEKLELDLEQAFDLVGYQFSLKEGKVRSTLEHLQTLSAI